MFSIVKQLTRNFGIMPERASRYFTLSIDTNLELPLPSTDSNKQAPLQNSLDQITKKYETSGALLLGFEEKTDQNKAKFTYFFQSSHEIEAFQFYKMGPLPKFTIDYSIQEIEMQNRIRDKQIAPKHLRQ